MENKTYMNGTQVAIDRATVKQRQGQVTFPKAPLGFGLERMTEGFCRDCLITPHTTKSGRSADCQVDRDEYYREKCAFDAQNDHDWLGRK